MIKSKTKYFNTSIIQKMQLLTKLVVDPEYFEKNEYLKLALTYSNNYLSLLVDIRTDKYSKKIKTKDAYIFSKDIIVSRNTNYS